MRIPDLVKKHGLVLWLCSCCLLIKMSSYAQEKAGTKTITGRVMAHNRPIQDAIIYIEGTNINTISDNNGRFSIQAKEGDILIISMIGYMQEAVKVAKSNNTLEVKLEENASKLDDVVVIGYGKSKRRDVTGAISSVSEEDIRKVQPVTLDQA